MSINLRISASASGTRNVYDNNLDFSSFGGSPGASGAANIAALASFNSAYAALSGRTQLYIPPGTYNGSTGFNFASSGGNANSLVVSAYGVTLTSPSDGSFNGFAVGGASGPYNDNTHNAKFVTATEGSSTITLVTAGQTSLFTVGKWVLLAGIDMQGGGFPQNPGYFEFKQILSIGIGTITFTEPLINTYEDTWPIYNAGTGSSIDQGGPGNIYVLKDPWNQFLEMKGVRFTDNGNGTYGGGRFVQWTDCTFDTYGPIPSMSLLYRSVRCTGAGFGGLEIDKCVHRIEFIDSMHRAVDFQSASINELYVSNMTQSPTPRWRGGASKGNTFLNLNTGTFSFGETNYGAMGPTYMENCVATTGDWFSANKFPFSDYTEEGGGVLSYAGGPSPASRTGYWAVPGTYCVLLDNAGTPGFAQSFQVLDVTTSGGRTYVTTNLPFPVPSTINGKSAPWNIASHPCADLTMINCSGNSMFTTQSALPAHTPFQSWTL